jgi:metallo-beta-lactamase family protein
MMGASSILFAGAAGEVTGSRHLLKLPQGQVLLDCGMFQGRREEARRKTERFLFDPATVDAVVLSHAHIDHCGSLPLLVKQGFKGRIICSEATADLARLLLLDSAHIQEMDARFWAKRHGGRRDFEPVYGTADAEACLERFDAVPYALAHEVLPGLRAHLYEAGHILGSAQISLRWEEDGRQRSLYYTGDLGGLDAPLLKDPFRPKQAPDVLLLESTYGDREHLAGPDPDAELAAAIAPVLARGGKVLIPAFAVGRTQELVYVLAGLFEQGKLKRVPVYVDSPLAARTTRLFQEHRNLMDSDFHADWKGRDPFKQPWLDYPEDKRASQALNRLQGPAIILAASGMCEAGRVLHHLAHLLPDPKNAVLFAGFQAQGTLGRRLKEGAKLARLYGEDVPVLAQVLSLDGFSAHAGRSQLLAFARALPQAPAKTWLVHGELQGASSLASELRQSGWDAEVPLYGKSAAL